MKKKRIIILKIVTLIERFCYGMFHVFNYSSCSFDQIMHEILKKNVSKNLPLSFTLYF